MRHFENESDARTIMANRNRASRRAGSPDLACLVEGPDDGWTVCDLRTAIETELPYEWSQQ